MENLNLKQKVKSGDITVEQAKQMLVQRIGLKDAMQTKTWKWLNAR